MKILMEQESLQELNQIISELINYLYDKIKTTF